MSANVAVVPDESLGEQVKRRRMALGLSLRQLEDEAGVGRARLAAIEKGDDKVREITTSRVLSTLDRLEHRYGVDDPDAVVNVLEVEMPDGRKVRATFQGSPEGMDEVVARLVTRLESGKD